MEQIVAYFSQHPALFAVAVVLSVAVLAFVLMFILKKVVQVVLVAAAFVVLYAAYLSFSGAGVSPLFGQLWQHFTTALHFISALFGH
jgi:hypothetical protein